jgi:CBS domain-containing protein
MEVELVEIREFLSRQAPFDHLPADVLDRLPRELVVRYLRRGAPFPPADETRDCLYIVRTGAVELRDTDAGLIDKFGEGESYSALCTAEHRPDARVQGRAAEDSLLYLLPCETLNAICRQYAEFNEHFNQSLRARLRHALELQKKSHAAGGRLINIPVRALIARAPVQMPVTASIREAASLMTAERVSALLLMEGERLAGLITDRDLRTRCVAAGLNPDAAVTAIMTRNVHTIAADSPAFEALVSMTRLNVHHLPVMDGGKVRGLVSTTDLIRHEGANAVYLVGDVRKCETLDDLRGACRQLPEMQLQLVTSGISPNQLGQAVSSVTDALTQRLLEIAHKELGPPPVPYVWLVVGSPARREQTVHSDQDNALLLSDDYVPEKHGAYFETLANRVTDGLNACGFVYCPGEVMARNPQWCQPARQWRAYFDGWITRPEQKALMLASNFFDMRPVGGESALHERLRDAVLRQAAENHIFLAHMAANALSQRPPLGFFRNFLVIHGGDYDSMLDLKLRGIMPIVDLGRVFALAAGLPQLNTVERLRAAASAGSLSDEGAADLEDALEFIATLRARHQTQQIAAGLKPDNYVKPDDLSQLERSYLKDAFSVIATMQSALAQRYQTERFF